LADYAAGCIDSTEPFYGCGRFDRFQPLIKNLDGIFLHFFNLFRANGHGILSEAKILNRDSESIPRSLSDRSADPVCGLQGSSNDF
jgi:hypothetical protein